MARKIELTVEMKEGKELAKRFSDRSSVMVPLDKGIKRITLKYEGLVKKATVVDTGRLRSSISHRYFDTGFYEVGAAVGTNVEYAPAVEYGQQRGRGYMAARHMEGQVKVLGMGMFAYAWDRLKEWAEKEGAEIAKRIGDKVCYGHKGE